MYVTVQAVEHTNGLPVSTYLYVSIYMYMYMYSCAHNVYNSLRATMKRDIIKLPQCPVAYNIMYNAHVHIHLDMYIKGCKHIQCTCIHVIYMYLPVQCTAVGWLSGCLHMLPAQAAEPPPRLSDHCKGEGEGEEAEGCWIYITAVLEDMQ